MVTGAGAAEPRLIPIGIIRTPFAAPEGAPIQPVYSGGAEGTVRLREDLAGALLDLEGFERIWLVSWLDRAGPSRPVVVPYRDTEPHGVLATRSPARPNPLGLSVVRLLGRDGAVLRVADVDLLDGTPILDIKPYVPAFDSFPGSRAGWLDRPGSDRRTADGRFHGGPGPSGGAPGS